jgi:hypothetical protein
MKLMFTLSAVISAAGVVFAAVTSTLAVQMSVAERTPADIFGDALDADDSTNGGFWTIVRGTETLSVSSASVASVSISSRSAAESSAKTVSSRTPGMIITVR